MKQRICPDALFFILASLFQFFIARFYSISPFGRN